MTTQVQDYTGAIKAQLRKVEVAKKAADRAEKAYNDKADAHEAELDKLQVLFNGMKNGADLETLFDADADETEEETA